jgi:hypothetical protein
MPTPKISSPALASIVAKKLSKGSTIKERM